MNTKNIVVGSTSQLKLSAVRKAVLQSKFSGIEPIGVSAQSGQNEQPVGFDETYEGALKRAWQARSAYPEALCIGIESGLWVSNSAPGRQEKFFDFAVIVLLTHGGYEISTTTSAIELPKKFVDIAQSIGFATKTVGSVIAEKLGGDPADPHTTLTNRQITREETIVASLTFLLRLA